MNDDTFSAEPAVVNALRDAILNPATSPLALAVDVPFKAAMLGLEWPEVRRLLDERKRRLARRDARRRPRTPPPAVALHGLFAAIQQGLRSPRRGRGRD